MHSSYNAGKEIIYLFDKIFVTLKNPRKLCILGKKT